jgi:hypothetical protein
MARTTKPKPITRKQLELKLAQAEKANEAWRNSYDVVRTARDEYYNELQKAKRLNVHNGTIVDASMGALQSIESIIEGVKQGVAKVARSIGS